MGSNSNTVHAVFWWDMPCHIKFMNHNPRRCWETMKFNCFCHVRIQAPLVFTPGIDKHNIEARSSNIKLSLLRVDRKQVDGKQKSWRKEINRKKTTTHNSNNKRTSKKTKKNKETYKLINHFVLSMCPRQANTIYFIDFRKLSRVFSGKTKAAIYSLLHLSLPSLMMSHNAKKSGVCQWLFMHSEVWIDVLL